ncbi:unnamed protein product [Lactuca saligna]|uniref:Uncharacterized protein n=1 Tax=Lactuca saligna TaxID=75948 RepID=A0AA35YDT9_LACSI|nr:unnamed protein product [Lactuca saligna]
MHKEIFVAQHDYASLNQKMDSIVDVVMKFVKLYEALSPKITQLSSDDSKSFMEVTTLLNELKTLISEPSSSPLITTEFLSQKFLLFESILHKQLAPLSQIINLLPSNAPPVVTGVQGEEKKFHVTKVVSTQIPTQIVSKVYTTEAIKTTTRPFLNGIAIGLSIDGGSSSSSKPNPSEDDGKGKGILVEKSKEERKLEIETKMDKQRQIQNILRLRENDPAGMEKRDPKKLSSYKNIKARVAFNHLYAFEKKPKKSYSITNTDMNQVDFPINKMMFIMAQYKIIENLDNEDAYIHMKLRFDVVVGKEPEEI